MNSDETLQAPGAERATARPDDRDASDVIEGDIGEARLKEPSDESGGADLRTLQHVVDVQEKQTEGSEADGPAKHLPPR
jgi:hypothetical protein